MATAFQLDAFQDNSFQIDAIVGGVYPDPSEVIYGLQYGPTGTDFTGTLRLIHNLDTGEFVFLLNKKDGISL